MSTIPLSLLSPRDAKRRASAACSEEEAKGELSSLSTAVAAAAAVAASLIACLLVRRARVAFLLPLLAVCASGCVGVGGCVSEECMLHVLRVVGPLGFVIRFNAMW